MRVELRDTPRAQRIRERRRQRLRQLRVTAFAARQEEVTGNQRRVFTGKPRREHPAVAHLRRRRRGVFEQRECIHRGVSL